MVSFGVLFMKKEEQLSCSVIGVGLSTVLKINR